MSRSASENGLPNRIAAMVRGPQSLREDIADEIADHLACHEEDKPTPDPDAAHAAAVRAFGNAEQVARELRAIHLGDLIMFQKITIAALVVIVAGMATTAYFSWQSSRQTTEQFAQMNQQLASLVELQRAAQPKPLTMETASPPKASSDVRLRLRCVLAPDGKPAAGRNVLVVVVVPGGSSARLVTDQQGCVLTGPISQGSGCKVYVAEKDTPINPDDLGQFIGFQTLLHAGERVDEQGNGILEYKLIVGSDQTYEVRLGVPDELSWDRQAMDAVRVQILQEPLNAASESHKGFLRTPTYACKVSQPLKISGLLPGPATVLVSLPNLTTPKHLAAGSPPPPPPGASPRGRRPPAPAGVEMESLSPLPEKDLVWYHWADVTIPATGGPIIAPLTLTPEDKLAGIIFDGSRDQPVASTEFELRLELDSQVPLPRGATSRVYRTEVLRTGPDGRFTAFVRQCRERAGTCQPSACIVPWKAPDGTIMKCCLDAGSGEQSPSPFRVYTLADASRFCEIDLSQIGLLRIRLTGIEDLSRQGVRLSGPVAARWTTRRSSQIGLPDWQTQINWPTTQSADSAMVSGPCEITAFIPTVEQDEKTPDLQRNCLYRFETREAKVMPGQVAEADIPLNELAAELEGLRRFGSGRTTTTTEHGHWTLEQSEWRQRGETGSPGAPSSQPTAMLTPEAARPGSRPLILPTPRVIGPSPGRPNERRTPRSMRR
jgi:hypothetical protein